LYCIIGGTPSLLRLMILCFLYKTKLAVSHPFLSSSFFFFACFNLCICSNSCSHVSIRISCISPIHGAIFTKGLTVVITGYEILPKEIGNYALVRNPIMFSWTISVAMQSFSSTMPTLFRCHYPASQHFPLSSERSAEGTHEIWNNSLHGSGLGNHACSVVLI